MDVIDEIGIEGGPAAETGGKEDEADHENEKGVGHMIEAANVSHP